MSSVRRFASGFLSLALVAGAILAVVNRQQIIDEISFRQYQPSAEIAQIADRSGMSAAGKRLFYIAHPQLKSAAEFNEECRRVEKASPILGCYDQSASAIYIYNVANPELDGVKEVTASHEMLHAAYARLSAEEKSRLEPLLEQAYQKVKTDKFTERMNYYERAQPGSRTNELHSILGTEFADLGSELEQYYTRYFSDRSAIVKLHAQYSNKFDSVENEASSLRTSLTARKLDIESRVNQYAADVEQYNQRVKAFNQKAADGGFASQDDFNAQRSVLRNRLTEINQRRTALNNDISQYNKDVARLRELGVKIDELNKSLDSAEGGR